MDASNFIKKLAENPEYAKMQERKEDELRKKRAEIKIIEEPIIEDFKKNGFDGIEDLDNLLLLKTINKKQVSLLLKWIPKVENIYNTKEMLIRGLALAEFPYDGGLLIKLFDSDISASTKWAIANTLSSGKAENISEWLVHQLSGNDLTKEKEMLIYAAIKYFDYHKASNILRKLFDAYPLQISDAFAIIGKKSDLQFLEEKSKNYRGVVRTQINKSIKKLSKKG